MEEKRPDESAESAVRRVGRRTGLRLGRERGGDGASTGGGVFEVLYGLGFEPERHERRILLRNCPFHELLDEHRHLVCAMNHSLLLGLVDGLGAEGVTARPWTEEGYCCVEVAPA
ncbi:MAG: hypothetical protein M3Q23_05770 [Actinomycetota bacterium]|nr:hypothetical protein [Actinomycetota bacterium]